MKGLYLMSMPYRLSYPSLEVDLLDPKWVTRHRGDPGALLARHRRQAKAVVKKGRSALEAVAPSLLYRDSHENTLRVAWDYLKEHGGQAPGPDELRYADLAGSHLWQRLRDLRNEIRAGEYRPDEERVCWISKGRGRGKRPLVIQSIIDRVVQRAVVEIVQPFVDFLFDERSFGFRPKRNPMQALALAERLSVDERRRVWVTADVRDAFLRVPLSRLLDIVRKYLIADDLVEFIRVVIGGASQSGLRQGGNLSPLLLNLYLHHCLDRRWRKLYPDIPLIRYADDLLLLCRSVAEARRAYRALAKLLRSAGMALKESCEEAVRTLTADEPVRWMGFEITKARKELLFGLTEQAWWTLEEATALAHEELNSPVRVYQAIIAWVGQKGPCYPQLDHHATYDRIADIARQQAFDEIPDQSDVKRLWQKAHARWGRARAKVAAHASAEAVTVPSD
jgi:retron-type reverse transcriptase